MGHGTVTGVLRTELTAGRLPRALLLSGPAYGGKLSVALELARALSCRRTGAWGCTCAPCVSQRDLSYPYLILLGWRYWLAEIRAAADLLRRSGAPAAYFFFVRAVRKLTRRYDRVIWEGDETRLRPALGPVSELNELLEGLTPALTGAALAARCNKIEAQAAKLAATVKTDNVPISQIRNVERWLHLVGPHGCKVVVVEHAEGLGESSRNALLRLLEEPPPETYVILLARRAAVLIPTLRSRLREYALRERSLAQQNQVLTRIFRQDEQAAPSLRSFFLSWGDVDAQQLREQADRFLAAVTGGEDDHDDWVAGPPGGYAEAAGLPQRVERERLLVFLDELAEQLRARLRAGGPPALLQDWAGQVDQCAARVSELRVQPRHALQSLGSALRRNNGASHRLRTHRLRTGSVRGG